MVDIKCIKSVVMMAPDIRYASLHQDGTELDRWYMMEKPGIKIGHMAGEEEFVSEEVDYNLHYQTSNISVIV